MAKKIPPDDLDKILERLGQTDLDDEIDAVHSGDAEPDIENLDFPADASETMSPNEADGDLITIPASALVVEEPASQITTVVKQSAQPSEDNPMVAVAIDLLNKIKSESDAIGKDIIGKWQRDNAQIDEVVGILLTDLRASTQNKDGMVTASEHVVQGLVKLLETKSNTSMVAVKLLEVRTKLLAAMKGSNIVVSNNNVVAGGYDKELTDILNNPVEQD